MKLPEALKKLDRKLAISSQSIKFEWYITKHDDSTYVLHLPCGDTRMLSVEALCPNCSTFIQGDDWEVLTYDQRLMLDSIHKSRRLSRTKRTCIDPMSTFKEAYRALCEGKAVKRAPWLGYRVSDGQNVLMHCKDGTVVSMKDGCFPMLTLGGCAEDD